MSDQPGENDEINTHTHAITPPPTNHLSTPHALIEPTE